MDIRRSLAGLLLIGLTAWSTTTAAQLLPPPGSVFREYSLDLDRGNLWRVTDPQTNHRKKIDFLPNSIHSLIVNDLEHSTRAELILDRWTGHPETTKPRVRFNDQSWLDAPSLATTPPGRTPEAYLAQDNPVVPVPLSDLHEGTNRLATTSGGIGRPGWGWGQRGMFGVPPRVYYDPQQKVHPRGEIASLRAGDRLTENPVIAVDRLGDASVSEADLFAYYRGPDTDGDGRFEDWHLQYRKGGLSGQVGRSVYTAGDDEAEIAWDTRFVPDQPTGGIAVAARLQTADGLMVMTPVVENLTLERSDAAVRMYMPNPEDVPASFVSRKNRRKSARLHIPEEPGLSLGEATEIALHLRTWNGHDESYFVNAFPLAIPIIGHANHRFADRPRVEVFEAIQPSRNGDNMFAIRSDTEHHGPEILWPGPVLTVRYPVPEPSFAAPFQAAMAVVTSSSSPRRSSRPPLCQPGHKNVACCHQGSRMNLSVCIEMLWPDLPYAQRLRRLAELGFTSVEFWLMGNKDGEELARLRDELGLTFVAMCLDVPAPLTQPGADGAYVDGVVKSAIFARSLGIETLIVTAGDVVPHERYETTWRRVERRLRNISRVAEGEGITVVLEPLNPLKDHVGHWLTAVGDAADLIESVDSDALKILFDLYHQQITEGDITRCLERWMHLIGHFHAAGVPERGDLLESELDYGRVFRTIHRLGYAGHVGLEYRPQSAAEPSLQQARELFDAATKN